MNRPQEITFGELRNFGVGGILIYCAGFTTATRNAGDLDDRRRA